MDCGQMEDDLADADGLEYNPMYAGVIEDSELDVPTMLESVCAPVAVVESIPMDTDCLSAADVRHAIEDVRCNTGSGDGKDNTALARMHCSSNVQQQVHDGIQKLFIVLDTNILLEHLRYIGELRDKDLGLLGRPTIVIPYKVTEELDHLKVPTTTKTGHCPVSFKAEQAISYIRKNLAAEHPRFLCETAAECDNQIDGYSAKINDDYILKCALQLVKNGVNAVLFTNDVNLINKALIEKVKAFDFETLLPGIQELSDKIGNKNSAQNHGVNVDTLAENEARKKEEFFLVDDVLCDAKEVVKKIIPIVLHNWKDKIFNTIPVAFKVKPPWQTCFDCLSCLDKHWLGFFANAWREDRLGRAARHSLDALLRHYNQTANFKTDIEDGVNLIAKLICLLHNLNHTVYDDQFEYTAYIAQCLPKLQDKLDMLKDVKEKRRNVREAIGALGQSPAFTFQLPKRQLSKSDSSDNDSAVSMSNSSNLEYNHQHEAWDNAVGLTLTHTNPSLMPMHVTIEIRLMIILRHLWSVLDKSIENFRIHVLSENCDVDEAQHKCHCLAHELDKTYTAFHTIAEIGAGGMDQDDVLAKFANFYDNCLLKIFPTVRCTISSLAKDISSLQKYRNGEGVTLQELMVVLQVDAKDLMECVHYSIEGLKQVKDLVTDMKILGNNFMQLITNVNHSRKFSGQLILPQS